MVDLWNPSPPIGLLAELTHRCPLQCPYCSNPLHLDRRSAELDTATWKQVFSEADALGVLQLHLSGGEPTARGDLVELVSHCAGLGLYTNLITSGVLLDNNKISALADAGLDHVQLSVQESIQSMPIRSRALRRPCAEDQGRRGRGGPRAAAHLNAVIHRRNIGSIEAMVELAVGIGARRIEIAHAQYYGWACATGRPSCLQPGQVVEADETVRRLRDVHAGRIVIDSVVSDYYARIPRPAWAAGVASHERHSPGKVLPCHAAETIPSWCSVRVTERSLRDIWNSSQAFNAYRELDWMEEPCVTCDRGEDSAAAAAAARRWRSRFGDPGRSSLFAFAL